MKKKSVQQPYGPVSAIASIEARSQHFNYLQNSCLSLSQKSLLALILLITLQFQAFAKEKFAFSPPPIIITAPDITVSCAVTDYLPATLVAQGIPDGQATAAPVVPADSLTFTDVIISVPCGGDVNGVTDINYAVERTWQAKNGTGNFGTVVQYIYFRRIFNGNIQFPADITSDCSSLDTAIANTGYPFITDIYRTGDLTDTAWLVPGNVLGFCDRTTTVTTEKFDVAPFCRANYKLTRTFVVMGNCNGAGVVGMIMRTGTQNIIVSDTQGPVFSCPPNVEISSGANCQGSYNLPDVIITDGCSAIGAIRANGMMGVMPFQADGTLTTFPGNNLWNPDTLGVLPTVGGFPLGATTITYTATDDCDNTATCSFTLTVVDYDPAQALCRTIPQITIGPSGVASLPASLFNDGSFDICNGTVAVKVRRTNASNTCQPGTDFRDNVNFCCTDVGTSVSVTLRAYDVAMPAGAVSASLNENRATSCTTSIMVLDQTKPVCVAPASVTVECNQFDPSLWAYGMLSASDNCSSTPTIATTVDKTGFDSMCTRGTIIRQFVATDASGNSCSSSQTITVNHLQNFSIKFPDDVVITNCPGGSIPDDLPVLTGVTCELGTNSKISEQTFTSIGAGCYQIVRKWHVSNLCTFTPNQPCVQVPNPNPHVVTNHTSNLLGPIVAPMGAVPPSSNVAITPGAPLTNFVSFFASDANCYEYNQVIRVSDSELPTFINCTTNTDTVKDLTANDPLLWNNSLFYDPVYTAHDLGESPSSALTIKGTDACSKSALKYRFHLYLDLDNNGTMETVVNSSNLPDPGTIRFNNANTPGFTGGTVVSFDNRAVATNQKYQFAVQTNIVNDTMVATLKWNTLASPNTFVDAQLPYGNHKIKWFMDDNCSNGNNCERPFYVNDYKTPTAFLTTAMSANMMPTGMLMVDASIFFNYAEDNMTPGAQVLYGITHGAPGTSFPVNASGAPITQVTLTCPDQIGLQPLFFWIKDLAGNATYIPIFINVNGANCPGGSGLKASVAGSVDGKDQNGATFGVMDVKVQVTGTHPAVPNINFLAMSDEEGKYAFMDAVPVGGNYTITPEKHIDPLNGVSAYDIVLLQKHILGIEALNSPYKMIAADINKSGSITGADITELRKLILGIYDNFPANKSWRFVNKGFVFPNPSNPFQTSFQESISLDDFQADNLDACFQAVKTGDLNNSAIINSLLQVDDRNKTENSLLAEEREVFESEVFTVSFNLSDPAGAYQFTLNYPGLDIIEVIPTGSLSQANFAVFNHANTITGVCEGAANNRFSITFRALSNGTLSQMLKLTDKVTPSAAYTTEGVEQALTLQFAGKTTSPANFELYQNAPNPFTSSTTIGFYMPTEGEAKLIVQDELGRQVYQSKQIFAKGYNTFVLDHLNYGGSGLLLYTVETAQGKATRKMIVK